MEEKEWIAVVLLQLGGPDSLDAVEPFLYNLFCDPDIIDLPLAFLFRKPLARFVAKRRTPKVQNIYRQIGGRSPILELTQEQGIALERQLRKSIDAKVFVAMRYWKPFTEEVIDELTAKGFKKVVLLPLYPHYSKTTTGSSVNEWNRILRGKPESRFETRVIEQYCEHPLYIESVVENLRMTIDRVPEADRPKVHLLFSAHGTPVKVVESGDPYQSHIIKTYEAILRKGNFGLPHHLCYQSKVGPAKWLEPSLNTTLHQLAEDKVSHVIAIPIAFVSDHSETLFELNIEARLEAEKVGIKYFDMMPALNSNPTFIQALSDLVLEKIKE